MESQAPELPADVSAVTPAAPATARNAAVWMAFLLLVVTVSGVTYFAYTRWQLLQADIESLRQQDSGLAASVSTQSQQLEQSLGKRQQEMEDRLQQLRKQVQQQEKAVHGLQTSDRDDWKLAEAEYLLRLASQRLLLTGDVDSAIALLLTADGILADMAQPALFDVRKAIAADVASLRLVADVDRSALWLALQGVMDRLPDLDLVTVARDTASATSTAPVPSATLAEEPGWQRVLSALRALVIVRHHDVPLKPLLPPEQEVYLQQNLRLMLEQAQLALLQRNQPVYSASLQKARQWLQQYYRISDPSVTALDQELTRLQAMPVEASLPSLDSSLAALRRAIEARHDVVRPAVEKTP